MKSGIWNEKGVLVLMLVLLALVGLGLNNMGTTEDKDKTPPSKIAVVNIFEIFRNYKKVQDFESLIEKDRQKEELKIQEIEKEIKTLMEEIDVLDSASPLRRDKNERLAMLSAQREQRAKSWNQFVRNKRNKFFIEVYDDIRKEINNYAKQKGLTLVLKSDPAEIGAEDLDENIDQQILVRSVLYHETTMDITPEVIAVLNK